MTHPELRARTWPTKGSYPNTGSLERISERKALAANGMITTACAIATANQHHEPNKGIGDRMDGGRTDYVTSPSFLGPFIEVIPFTSEPYRAQRMREMLNRKE